MTRTGRGSASRRGPESDSGGAKKHIQNFSGRSSFLVFVRLPDGRTATYDYFQSLWNSPEPYVPDLLSFPAGTEVALVRLPTLIDSQGNLVASPIIESVQIRAYRRITKTEEGNFVGGNVADIVRSSGQKFYEIKLSRPLLFSGKNGGLRAVGPDEKELSTFQTQGNDPIDGSSSAVIHCS